MMLSYLRIICHRDTGCRYCWRMSQCLRMSAEAVPWLWVACHSAAAHMRSAPHIVYDAVVLLSVRYMLCLKCQSLFYLHVSVVLLFLVVINKHVLGRLLRLVFTTDKLDACLYVLAAYFLSLRISYIKNYLVLPSI